MDDQISYAVYCNGMSSLRFFKTLYLFDSLVYANTAFLSHVFEFQQPSIIPFDEADRACIRACRIANP
jgi:hypothetical protein